MRPPIGYPYPSHAHQRRPTSPPTVPTTPRTQRHHHHRPTHHACTRTLSLTRATTSSSPSPLTNPANPLAVEMTDALRAVRLASDLCVRVQRDLGDDEQKAKNDDSPVTVADFGAQAIVAWALSHGRAHLASPTSSSTSSSTSPSTSSALPALSLVAEESSAYLQGPDKARLRQRVTSLVNDVLASANEPAFQTLTEENVLALIDLGGSPGGATGRHWVLDPIDGTRGFVGQRQYAVCLGLLDAGEVVLGVLGCPNLPRRPLEKGDGSARQRASSSLSGTAADDHRAERLGDDGVALGTVFAASRGQGSYWGPLRGREDPAPNQLCRMDPGLEPGGVSYMESFESRHSSHGLAARVAEGAGFAPESLQLDSQVKYGCLARGDAGAWMRFPPKAYREKIWDHAAGQIVVQEAGGVVTDAVGNPLDFGRGRFLDQERGIVAGPPRVHARIIAEVAFIPEEEEE